MEELVIYKTSTSYAIYDQNDFGSPDLDLINYCVSSGACDSITPLFAGTHARPTKTSWPNILDMKEQSTNLQVSIFLTFVALLITA